MTNTNPNDDNLIQAEGPDVETGINDQTGEYGPGVDQDTGANVGDTGTPELDESQTERVVDDELHAEEDRDD